MAQNGFQSGKLEKNMVPKRHQFRNPFWHGFWIDMKLKMQVFGGPWKAPWHYYSNVFGVCRCLSEISHRNCFGIHFGGHFEVHLGTQIRLVLYRGRPKRIPSRPEKAWTAIGRGSRNGSKNKSEKYRSDVENGPADHPPGRVPETTGRN